MPSLLRCTSTRWTWRGCFWTAATLGKEKVLTIPQRCREREIALLFILSLLRGADTLQRIRGCRIP